MRGGLGQPPHGTLSPELASQVLPKLPELVITAEDQRTIPSGDYSVTNPGSLLSLLVVSVAIVGLFVLAQTVLSGLRNPLSHVPGPWYSRYTRLVYAYYLVTAQDTLYVHRLHEKYGPIVRFHPSMVNLADPEAGSRVMRLSHIFPKGPQYNIMLPGLISIRNNASHSRRRRIFTQPLSKRSIQTVWEPRIRERIELAVSSMRKDALRGSVDIMKWVALLASDIVTNLSFGESFRMLETGKQTPLIEAIRHVAQCTVYQACSQRLYDLASLMPIEAWQRVLDARNVVRKFTNIAVDNFRAGHGSYSTPTSIFSRILDQSKGKECELTEQDVRNEAVTMVFAGSDTTYVTLSYLIWSILKKPTLQEMIEQDVAKLSEALDIQEVERMPLLNAAIEETLRLYGPVQGPLQRVVPSEGSSFCGYSLPGGTFVTCQAYTMHQNPATWPDPTSYDETRFLNKSLTRDQQLSFMPFGGGSRACIGIHLAYMEIRLCAAIFFRQCRGAKLADCMKDDMMDMVRHFVSKPKGPGCYITLDGPNNECHDEL